MRALVMGDKPANQEGGRGEGGNAAAKLEGRTHRVDVGEVRKG